MIVDPQELQAITQSWRVVRTLCESSHRQVQVPGGPFYNETRPEDSYNLPFVLAYAVLDEVLDALLRQGVFSCSKRRPTLKDLMDAARPHLPWRDFALVDTGKGARNKLAHKAVLLSKTECLRFVDAIERELVAWGIVR